MVLVLAGILMAMMAPVLKPGRWRADSAIRELTLSLNAAQRLAVMRQHDIVATFEVTENKVRVLQDQNNNGVADPGESWSVIELPETISFGMGGAPALPEGPGPVSFRDNSDGPTVTFHRNGSASETGAAYVYPARGSLSDGTEGVRALTIERATGEIRCYSYRSGSWEAAC
jgi:Tfp pilus assembly protein FimT